MRISRQTNGRPRPSLGSWLELQLATVKKDDSTGEGQAEPDTPSPTGYKRIKRVRRDGWRQPTSSIVDHKAP